MFSAARIRLYLNNQGPEAIKGYGPEIVIERKLSKLGNNGVSYFKVMNSALRTQGTGLKAVTAIVDSFNINVTNPCVILKQSIAKQFLTNTNSGDKYKFFVQSSKLADYERQLEEACNNVYQAREQQKNSKGSFKEVKAQFLAAEQQYQQLMDNRYVI